MLRLMLFRAGNEVQDDSSYSNKRRSSFGAAKLTRQKRIVQESDKCCTV